MRRQVSIYALLITGIMLLAACSKETTVIEKNYADDFVGNYSVKYYPNITATLPVIGEQELNLGPISATAQIVKNGDYGDVFFIMNGDTVAGICYKRGLKLETQTSLGSANTGLSVSYTFYLSHPVIAAPQNGVMQWESPTKGSVTMFGYTGEVEGTTRFVATKQ